MISDSSLFLLPRTDAAPAPPAISIEKSQLPLEEEDNFGMLSNPIRFPIDPTTAIGVVVTDKVYPAQTNVRSPCVAATPDTESFRLGCLSLED